MESTQTSGPNTADSEAAQSQANEPDSGQDSATATVEQAQDVMDVEQAKGFSGVKVDPTPDMHYAVEGVIAGKPTPETDPDAHAEAHFAARMEGRFPAPK